MDLLKKIFPFSFNAKDVTALVIAIVLYLVGGTLIDLVLALVFGLLSGIPLIGILFGILGWVVGTAVGAYCLVGLVLAVLTYFNLIKE